MESEKKQVTAVLGDEYDLPLRQELIEVLQSLSGLQIDSQWSVAGSQELDCFTVEIFGSNLVVEAETYIGLTITGPEEIVAKVQRALGSKRSGDVN
jgi:hypothetical protein